MSWNFSLVENRFKFISKNTKEILGCDSEELSDFNSWNALIHEDDQSWTMNFALSQIEALKNYRMTYRIKGKNSKNIWILELVTVGKDAEGKANTLYGFSIDITENKEREIELEKEQKYLESILNGMSDPITLIDTDYNVQPMNNAARLQVENRVLTKGKFTRCHELMHAKDTPCEEVDTPCPLQIVLETKKTTTVLQKQKNFDGSEKYVEIAASPIFNGVGECTGVIELARDITSHVVLSKQLEAKTKELEAKTKELEYQATHDSLTGLANRALFMDRLEQSIKDAKRNKQGLTLFYMDLDHFKEVNDVFGHHVGDAVLKKVSDEFRKNIRENDILSRLGGDEFTVILKNIADKDAIVRIAQNFLNIFTFPLFLEGHHFRLSISIGISIYKTEDTSIDRFIQEADDAMYKAKSLGKSNFQFFFNPSISEDRSHQLDV